MKIFLMFLMMGSVFSKPISEKELFFRDLNLLVIQRDVVRMNIFNHKTTRTPEGGPYLHRKVEKCHNSGCVIKPSGREHILVYEPNHPDALKNGYVRYPSINLEEEREELKKLEMAIKLRLDSKPFATQYLFSDEAQDLFKKYKSADQYLNIRKNYLYR